MAAVDRDRRRSNLRHWLEEAARRGDVPGAAWVVARGRRVVDAGVVGWSAVKPRRRRLRPGTLFDLASLTKPLATAALAVILQARRRLDLRAPASVHLPELGDTPWRTVTVEDLLLHRSGLPAWRPFFLEVSSPDALVAAIARLAPAAPPARMVIYSDPGYFLCGVLLARAGGRPLDALYRRHVLHASAPAAREPRFRPPRSWAGRIAPTEEGDAIQRTLTVREVGEATAAGFEAWHRGVLRGAVHDRNCRAIGGVAGNAGLFGSAEGVAALAAEFLPGSRLFGDEERALFSTSRTPGLEQDRALGFRVAAGRWAMAGDAVSGRAFGHTGFTGPSLLIDPATGGIFVLLTNRVHPRARVEDLTPLRRGFHERAAALLAAS